MNKRIVCAAIQHSDGRIICGPRHYDTIMREQLERLADAWTEGWRKAEQGFIDNHGSFWTREDAWTIADAEGQILRERNWQTGKLHSEHLY